MVEFGFNDQKVVWNPNSLPFRFWHSLDFGCLVFRHSLYTFWRGWGIRKWTYLTSLTLIQGFILYIDCSLCKITTANWKSLMMSQFFVLSFQSFQSAVFYVLAKLSTRVKVYDSFSWDFIFLKGSFCLHSTTANQSGQPHFLLWQIRCSVRHRFRLSWRAEIWRQEYFLQCCQMLLPRRSKF